MSSTPPAPAAPIGRGHRSPWWPLVFGTFLGSFGLVAASGVALSLMWQPVPLGPYDQSYLVLGTMAPAFGLFLGEMIMLGVSYMVLRLPGRAWIAGIVGYMVGLFVFSSVGGADAATASGFLIFGAIVIFGALAIVAAVFRRFP